MLKLSIALSLIDHTITSGINYSLNVFNKINEDEDINNLLKEKHQKEFEKSGTPIADSEKYQKELFDGAVQSVQEFTTTYKDKLKVENKFLKTDVNDNEFTLEIKEEFLKDVVDCAFTCYEKLIPTFVKLIPGIVTVIKINEEFKAKWYEPKPVVTETTVESEELTTVFSSNGWDFTMSKYNTPIALLLKDGESTVMTDDFKALNKETKAMYNIYNTQFKYVLDNEEFYLDTFPKSLQAALKDLLTEYYKVEM